MRLATWLGKRLAAIVLSLLVVSLLVFSVIHLTPGSPEQALLGTLFLLVAARDRPGLYALTAAAGLTLLVQGALYLVDLYQRAPLSAPRRWSLAAGVSAVLVALSTSTWETPALALLPRSAAGGLPGGEAPAA